MKQGLLLTLKELIRLGIIKTKRRKKRRSSQLTTMSSMGKGPTGIPLSIQSKRYNEFISATNPSPPMAYTDNLRLRDEQANFNTRLLEYKNQLENEKSLLENRQKAIMDDISYSKAAVGNALIRLSNKLNRNVNWENDNIDVVETFGSDSFKSQRDEIIEPPQPQTQPQFVEEQPLQFGEEQVSQFEEEPLSQFEEEPSSQFEEEPLSQFEEESQKLESENPKKTRGRKPIYVTEEEKQQQKEAKAARAKERRQQKKQQEIEQKTQQQMILQELFKPLNEPLNEPSKQSKSPSKPFKPKKIKIKKYIDE